MWPSTTFGPVHPLGERSTIMGQRGRVASPVDAGVLLDRANFQDALLQRRSHFLMHRGRIIALDEIRFVAVSDQQRLQFFMRNAREDRGIRDLVAVEVQHRQHRPIANGIQEFIRMPGGGKRTGFGLAVSYSDGNDEVRIVESRSVRMRDGIAQFAAFVNRTRRFRRAVRADSAGKRKLLEEFEQAGFVAALVGINLGVVAFEVAVGQRGRRAVTRAGDVHDIQVIFLDEPIQMNPNQRLSGIGPPMTKKPILDVLRLQGLAKQRIRAKIDHSCRQIIAGMPVSIDLSQLVGCKRRQNLRRNSHGRSPRLKMRFGCKHRTHRCSSLEPKLFCKRKHLRNRPLIAPSCPEVRCGAAVRDPCPNSHEAIVWDCEPC